MNELPKLKRKTKLYGSNETKKSKNVKILLLEELRPLGFRDSVYANTIQCTFNPNENVIVFINILNAKELHVHVVFRLSREIVEIQDKSFGKYPINLKIQRLVNLQNKLKCLRSRRDELFADRILNWEDFTKCNYENFIIFNHIGH